MKNFIGIASVGFFILSVLAFCLHKDALGYANEILFAVLGSTVSIMEYMDEKFKNTHK